MKKIKMMLALLAALVCGGAWAGSPDENGIVPTYWWTFDSSNLNGSSAGANSVNWSGSSSYEDSPRLRACKGGDPYLNNGLTAEAWTSATSFSLVGSYKIDLSNGKSKALLFGIGWRDNCFVLAADATKAYLMWNSSRVSYTDAETKSSLETSSIVNALSLGTADLTSAYHSYALVYDHDNSTVYVYVDGIEVLKKTDVTIALAGTGWSGNNPKCAGILSMPGGGEDDYIGASRTSTRCDDFRIYAQALTAAQLKNMTADFTYNPGPGNVPMGWVTGYGSGNEPFRNNTLVVAPDNALCHVVESETGAGRPWTAMDAKAAFTFAVRADVSAMSTSSKRVVVAVGNNSQNVFLARNNDKVVLVHTASGATIEADLPATGFHTYVFTKDATGMALYIDGEQKGEKNTSATGNVSTGLQFGSVYNGRPSGVDIGVGCRIANAKGWSRVLSDSEITAVCTALPAVTDTLPVTGTIEIPTTVTTAIQSSLPLSGTGKIVTPFVACPERISNNQPQNFPSFDSTWTGTLEIAEKTIASGNWCIPLHKYGSSTDATVILKGLNQAGWINGNVTGGTIVNATVQIDGTTVFEQGSSGASYIFKKLTGAGDLTLSDWSGANSAVTYTIEDLSDYTGTLTLKSTSSVNFNVNLTNITKTDVVPGEPLVKVTTSGSRLVFNVDSTTLNGEAANLFLKDDGVYLAIAQIGSQKYESLSAAINAAGTPTAENPVEITLLKDCAETVVLKENMTVQTNGKQFNGTVTGAGKVVFGGDYIPAVGPGAGVTYRFEGSTNLPYMPLYDQSFEGTIEIARGLDKVMNADSDDGMVSGAKGKVIFDTGFTGINLANCLSLGASDGANQTFVQKAGVITLTRTGNAGGSCGDSPFIPSRYPVTVTYDLKNGSIVAENGKVQGWDGGVTMTIGDADNDSAVALFKAKGIEITRTTAADKRSSITVVQHGTVEVGDGGIALGNTGNAMTFNGGTLKTTATTTVSVAGGISVGANGMTIDVAENTTLTITAAITGSGTITKTGAGTLKITGSKSGFTGTINVSAGKVAVEDSDSPSMYSTTGTGSIVLTEPMTAYAQGNFTVSGGWENLTIGGILRPTGVIATPEQVAADRTVKIDGIVTSFDVTYTNVNAFAYRYKQTGTCRSDNSNNPSYNNQNADKTTGVLLKYRPWIQDIDQTFFTNTKQITLATAGMMSKENDTMFLHMGSSANAGNYGLYLATGKSDDEVIVGYNVGRATTNLISKITVPNARKARHTYVITKDDDIVSSPTKTTFTIYLDGEKWETFVVTPRFEITGGFQVGSDFGGYLRENNLVKAVPNNDNTEVSYVNFIRVYDRIISEAEIRQYSVPSEYPYNSPNGTYQRSFTGSEGQNWKGENGAWSSSVAEETAGVQLPTKGLVIANFAATTTVTVNQSESTSYEKLAINGPTEGSATITFEKGDGAVKAIKAVATTINTPIILNEGTIDLTGGPTKLGEKGSVTFNFTSLTASQVANDGGFSQKVTGVTLEDIDLTKFTVNKSPSQKRLNINVSRHADDGCIYVEASVTPTTVYAKTFDLNSFSNEDGTEDIELVKGDTVVIPATCKKGDEAGSKDAWHALVNNIKGHAIIVEQSMNWHGEIGNVTIGNNAVVYAFADTTFASGASVKGASSKAGQMRLSEDVTIGENATILATVDLNNRVFKLADGKTLTVAEKLAEGAVKSAVNTKMVDYTAETKTYSLVDIVATVDGVQCDSLEAAFELAKDQEDKVVTLTKAVSGNLSIPVGVKAVDAGSYDISGEIIIPEDSTLTVSGDRTTNGISGEGKLVVSSGAIIAKNKSAGYAVDGTTVQIDGGTFTLTFGNSGAYSGAASDPTIRDAKFIIGESGTLTNNGWLNIVGSITLSSESTKTVFSGSSFRGAPTVTKSGDGAITFDLSNANGKAEHKFTSLTLNAGTFTLKTAHGVDSAISGNAKKWISYDSESKTYSLQDFGFKGDSAGDNDGTWDVSAPSIIWEGANADKKTSDKTMTRTIDTTGIKYTLGGDYTSVKVSAIVDIPELNDNAMLVSINYTNDHNVNLKHEKDSNQFRFTRDERTNVGDTAAISAGKHLIEVSFAANGAVSCSVDGVETLSVTISDLSASQPTGDIMIGSYAVSGKTTWYHYNNLKIYSATIICGNAEPEEAPFVVPEAFDSDESLSEADKAKLALEFLDEDGNVSIPGAYSVDGGAVITNPTEIRELASLIGNNDCSTAVNFAMPFVAPEQTDDGNTMKVAIDLSHNVIGNVTLCVGTSPDGANTVVDTKSNPQAGTQTFTLDSISSQMGEGKVLYFKVKATPAQ